MLAVIDASTTQLLRTNPPALHGGGHYFGLTWKALEWLESALERGMHTLETGSGASTIVFASRGANHIAVSPAPAEHERIREFCATHAISTETVRFVAESSHTALTRLETGPLDIVLIDGAHGFPYPILDWYFVQDRVKVGGAVLVDDAYMPPVNGLVDNLKRTRGWELAAAPGGRTAVLRKTAPSELSFDALDSEWAPTFNYLPVRKRVIASLRYRTLDRGPLAALVRRRNRS